jgi:hypothetical protein
MMEAVRTSETSVDNYFTRQYNPEYSSEYLFHTSKGSLTCHKILQHGTDGFTPPPKEGVLRISIALKNPSPSAGFEPANVASTLITQPLSEAQASLNII